MNHRKRIFICILVLAVILGGITLPSMQTLAENAQPICYFSACVTPVVTITPGNISGVAPCKLPEFGVMPSISETTSGGDRLADCKLLLWTSNKTGKPAAVCALPAPVFPSTNKKIETMRN